MSETLNPEERENYIKITALWLEAEKTAQLLRSLHKPLVLYGITWERDTNECEICQEELPCKTLIALGSLGQ